MGRARAVIVAVALSMLLVLATAAPAAAITLGVGWSGVPAYNAPEMPLVAKSGAATFRVPFGSGNEELVEAAAKSGITIHAEISTGHSLPTGTARTEFLNSVYSEVVTYGYNGTLWAKKPWLSPHPITTWEVFNEPNLWGISATEYGQFVNEVASQIQAASLAQSLRRTNVLAGGLLIEGTVGQLPYRYYGALKYLEEEYAQFGSNPAVTGVAVHPYEIYPETFPGLSRIKAFETSVTGIHEKLAELAHGGTQKSLWITEAGWPAGGNATTAVSEEGQATLLRQAVGFVKSNESALNLKEFLWYNFRDPEDTSEDWGNWCGLRDHGGRFRPAWSAFQEQAGVPQVIPQAPAVESQSATGVHAAQATLNGSINPHGLPASYRFEYGETPSFGSSAPIPDGSAGEGEAGTAESVKIQGLRPDTTYYYRLVGGNAVGSTAGATFSFHTRNFRYMLGISSGGGLGSWNPILSTRSRPSLVARGDWNGDGKADLVAIESTGSSSYRIMLGTSNGAGLGAWNQIGNITGTDAPTAVAVGDLTGDKKADLITAEDE